MLKQLLGELLKNTVQLKKFTETMFNLYAFENSKGNKQPSSRSHCNDSSSSTEPK